MKKYVPLWVVPLLIVGAIGTVWLRLTIVRTTYEIGQVDRIGRNINQQAGNLEARVAQLRSPKRLQYLASSLFRLAPPQEGQIVHLDSSIKYLGKK